MEGKACDCCIKHASDIIMFAKETIPIAARMGRDPKIFHTLADWARQVRSITSVEQIKSGQYDDVYLQQAGVASNLRKQVESLLAEVRPKGFRETCVECGAVEDLREWLKRKGAEGG